MGKLVKPKKPNVKKPRLPAKPREPKKTIGATIFENEEWYCMLDEHNELYDIIPDDAVQYKEVNKLVKRAEKFLASLCKEGFEEDGISLKVGNFGNIDIHFPRLKYDEELVEYKKKLAKWEEKVKDKKPELDKYDLAMKKYQIELHKWKIEKAHQELRELEAQSIAG